MITYHLGIYAGHDTGVAVVDENLNVVHLFEEERFNGEKMTYFNPYFALKEIVRLDLKHFKTITFGFNPDEAQADFLKKFVRFQKVRSEEILEYLSGKMTWDEVCFTGHHDCHAAGAFFPSGFDNALIMVADGTGESEATSFYGGKGTAISRISRELTNDFSLGILYQYFTEWLGYRSHNTSQHCGKIMGLASYGKPVYKERILEMLRSSEGAGYRWPGGSLLEMRGEIAAVFGPPRPRPTNHFSVKQADVACSIQEVLEEIVLEKLEVIREIHPFQNLCFSGGVAMNSLLNYRILKSGVCNDIFVQPLSSDRGIALGAALAAAARSSSPNSFTSSGEIQNVYVGYGESSPQGQLARVIREYDLPIFVESRDVTPQEIAGFLDAGQILSLFQGKQEIGPRALGNRSIMAAPTVASRDRTNEGIKYRESWRPFAPTIIEEEVGRYFDSDRAEPFMSVIYGVLPDRTKGMEGVTHVDGTARLQTVSEKQNPLFYEIIKEYGKISGIPVILNTSFNINAQPIIRTVYDAVLTFLCCGIDGLLIENTLVRKKESLPRECLNRLDRILAEVTRDARSIVLQILDYSEETQRLLSEILGSPSIRFRKCYGSKPIARCFVKGHTKMSWNILSDMTPYVEQFIYGEGGSPRIDDNEICILVSGKKLIEASSKPTRTYVGFDREVHGEIIRSCHAMPGSERYYFLDREYHLFDVDYLYGRLEPFRIEEARTLTYGDAFSKEKAGKVVALNRSREDNVDEKRHISSEQEDMYETLADA